jgi:hypothetical protein
LHGLNSASAHAFSDLALTHRKPESNLLITYLPLLCENSIAKINAIALKTGRSFSEAATDILSKAVSA